MMGWIIPLLVIGVVAALPWFAEGQRHSAEAFRAQAPGRFAKLSQGVTHYQWLGSARGPVVVCVHGLATPSPVWYAIADGLAKLGYRVLVYDLYGRGFSDAPRGAQDGDFFGQQLLDLLEHQGLEDDVTLMGYSMGGSIATHFTAQNPGRVRRLVLLASGGAWLREDKLIHFSRTIPFFGDWLFAVLVSRIERRNLRTQLGKNYDIKGIVELQLAEYQSRGFVRSVLSSRRHMLDDMQEDAHRTISREGVPVVAIWAEKDEIIPLKSLGTLTQWNRAIRQEVVQGAAHDIGYANSAEVIDLLASVLREDMS
ncbi:alpha/beta hydrolase [Octadecabacter sp. 1_MG-2023]|uniref:alpha/beta fold hydrolase n=1 Tax=unclassified Octadecabacter TaxID=196158 RepID=UPI001C083580|nr:MULTISPECIES: alpha/beta hydrolase [unclassified Octadecabacter]MBU2992512.1 alpha/beta hydrolase [Octadecabacter sp. B2R22]MDO6734731.1 alpha/beta hydrolase [Octadecabacter sp. 1_MG-2023]